MGHGVELAESISHARRVISEKKFGLAILSLDGVGSEGFDFAEELRSAVGETLLIRTESNFGASNHEDVIDPSDDDALMARVNHAVRLQHDPDPPRQQPIQFAGYTLDLDGAALINERGKQIVLTRGEFALLREFVRAAGRVLSREHLRAALTGRDTEPYERSMDMLVVRLRRKIERDPKNPSLIITVPGQGYKFAVKPHVSVVPEETPAVSASSPPASVIPCHLAALSVELVPADAGSPAPDPEDLAEIVEAYHREATGKITLHGGVVTHCSVHEVVALFGCPVAQEDAAGRAVRAGIALLEGGHNDGTAIPPGLALRAGIATGLVVAYELATGCHQKRSGTPPSTPPECGRKPVRVNWWYLLMPTG
jgi:DNA-binding response OmpR family regulator